MANSGNVRSCFFASFTVYVAVASAREDAHASNDASKPEWSGVSLMQSGRSMLPASTDKLLHIGEFTFDSADDFATMEDEFDTGVLAAHVADMDELVRSSSKSGSTPPLVCMLDHFGDILLYLEALLVVGIIAGVRRAVHWVRHASTNTALSSPSEAAVVANKIMVHEDEDLAVPFGNDFAIMTKAIRDGDLNLYRKLIKEGGRRFVQMEDACGCTSLHYAAHHGSAAVARLLLAHGANVNATEAWEETPLHIAARMGSLEVCDLLLDHGSEIDAVNARGQTPLVVAGESQQEATCELLLSHGAGVGGAVDGSLPPLLNTLLFCEVLQNSPSACEVREATSPEA